MKVLIIGFGSIAKKHCRVLRQINPDVNIVALRSGISIEISDDIDSVFSIDEALKHKPYDFIIISNPTNKHAESIIAGLEFNCPIFIEKPLFDSIQPIHVLDSVLRKGTQTYVACNLRFLDSLIYLKEHLIDRITVNEVNVYCGSYLPSWRSGIDYKLSYSAHKDQGGGAHLDLIHELDYVYWLFGPANDVRSTKRSSSTLKIDSVDYANYLLQYDAFAINIILNYYRRDSKRSIELVCIDDTYVVDLLLNTVSSTKETLFTSDQSINDTYKAQMQYFLGVLDDIKIGKRDKGMNDVTEAFEVLKICMQ